MWVSTLFLMQVPSCISSLCLALTPCNAQGQHHYKPSLQCLHRQSGQYWLLISLILHPSPTRSELSAYSLLQRRKEKPRPWISCDLHQNFLPAYSATTCSYPSPFHLSSRPESSSCLPAPWSHAARVHITMFATYWLCELGWIALSLSALLP